MKESIVLYTKLMFLYTESRFLQVNNEINYSPAVDITLRKELGRFIKFPPNLFEFW